MEQLLSDAKHLAQRLQNHDTAADALISDASTLETKLQVMKEYREEVTKLNDIAKHRPRSTLILGSQLENQRIRDLENENSELHVALADHQSTLELIMNKYREQVLNLLAHKGLDKAALEHMSKSSGDVSMLKEKVTEMAVVMHRAVQADEEVERCDFEVMTKLKYENKVLRDLLNISGHPKKEIEKLKLKQLIEREQSFMNGGVVAAGNTTDHSIESSADEQEHHTGTVKRRFKGQVSEVVSNGQSVNDTNQTEGAFADYPGHKTKSVKENASQVGMKNADDEVSIEQTIGDAESLKDIVDSIDKAKDEGDYRLIAVEENVTSLEVSDSETVNSDCLDDTISLGSAVDEPKYSVREIENIEREMLVGGSEREDPSAMGIGDFLNDGAISGDIAKEKSEHVSSTPRSGSFNEDKDIDIVDAVTRCDERKEQEQILDLYNSEGIILDDSDEPLASGGKGSGGKSKARKISAHDSKISGLKIRRSTKQKKVIQADLKSFFAREEEDTKEEGDRVDGKVDEEGIKSDSEREEDTTERNSVVDTDEIDAEKAENLEKDSSLDDGYGSPNSPRPEDTKDSANEDISPTAVDLNVLDATLGSKEGLAIEPPLSSKEGLTTKVSPANKSSTYEHSLGGKQAREDGTSQHRSAEPNVVSNVSLDDIFTPPESPIESPDMTDPRHKTIQLDYSDSDSDDPEMMIEDQFADIIGSDSCSDSSSEGSDSDLEVDRKELTEEEIVGDLDKSEDTEYVFSRWVRSDVEKNSDGLEAEERPDENTGSSSVLSSSIKGPRSDDVAGTDAKGDKSQMNDNKKQAQKEQRAGQNDEDFVFNEAYLQMDQFDHGSMKAKYAKRKKNYQTANRASAVTLFAGQAAVPVSGTRSNIRSDSELQSKEETTANGSAADVSTLDAIISPRDSPSAPNASSSAPSNAKSEATTDRQLASAPSDISLSGSSSEEIDPGIFKRKLAGVSETRDQHSKCGSDLSDLLGDLDAALELEDSDE